MERPDEFEIKILGLHNAESWSFVSIPQSVFESCCVVDINADEV